MAVCKSPIRTQGKGALRRTLTASAAITALACVAPAGIAALSPGQAKAQECGPLPGVGTLLCPTSSYPTGIDYSGVAGDILIDLDAASDVAQPVVLDATGDIVFTAQGDTTLTGGSGGGLVATAGDLVDLTLDSVQTTADNGVGVLANAGGDASLTVDEILTSGDDADAVNITAGDTITVTAGSLMTSGDDSDGVELVSLSGPVSLDADVIETLGEASSGAVVEAVGDTDVSVGVLTTQGFQAVGLDLSADPVACVVLGAGACDTNFDVGQLTTTGDGGTGALVRGAGNVTGSVDLLSTSGDDAAGIDIAVDPDVCLVIGAANCAVTVDAGDVNTEGDGSEGVLVDGGAGDVTVDVGSTTTSGAGSDGINTSTTTGDTTITVGDVTTTGPGSDGIEADSVSGDIVIVINDDVTATGDGANADTGGSVEVTVGPGADVFGGDDALDLTSGTGTTVTNNGVLEGGTGMAINAHGAAAMIDNNGTIIGGVSLTGAGDTLTNDGMFMADEDSDFGAGTDAFTNNGQVTVMGDVAFTGLEQLTNNGLIDMIDGATDDSLTLPGNFSGGADSELAVDAALGEDGTPADRLVVGGTAGGVTTITVHDISDTPGVLNPDGVVIVDADAAADGTFVLGGGTIVNGFVDFDIMTDGGQVMLVGSPNQSAFEVVRLGQTAQESWYASADAWRGAMINGHRPHDGARWWGQFYGSDRSHDGNREVTAFGVTSMRDLSYSQQHWGYQMGADWGMGGGRLGVTAGYGAGTTTFDVTGHDVDYTGWNLGLYGAWGGETGLRIDLLGKYDSFSLGYNASDAGLGGDLDGRSWGLQAEIGYRMGSDFYVEPQASLAYVDTHIDGFQATSATVDYHDAESMRGKAGVLVGWQGGDVHPFLGLHAVREFQGENEATFSSGGFDLPLVEQPDDTYGLVTLGAEAEITGVDAFAHLDAAVGDVDGWGLRFGIRTAW